ncbi:MAG: hypothetical protein ACL93V_15000 [Candidatus Electrothrix sp. YB6]
MQKFIFTTVFALVSVFSVTSVSAGDVCLKGYGKTPDEAFQAGVKLLEEKDAEMGQGWMKDNMQLQLLPKKEKGLFVSVVYSVHHEHQELCGLKVSAPKVADTAKANCDKTICEI